MTFLKIYIIGSSCFSACPVWQREAISLLKFSVTLFCSRCIKWHWKTLKQVQEVISHSVMVQLALWFTGKTLTKPTVFCFFFRCRLVCTHQPHFQSSVDLRLALCNMQQPHTHAQERAIPFFDVAQTDGCVSWSNGTRPGWKLNANDAKIT